MAGALSASGGTRRAGALAGLSGASAAIVLAAVLHTVAPAVPFPPQRIAQALVRAAPGGFATYFIERLGHWALRLAVAGTAAAFVASGAALGLAIPALTARIRGRAALAAGVAFVPLWAVGVILYPPDPQDVARGVFALVTLPVFAVAAYLAGRVNVRLTAAPAPEATDLSRRTLLRAGWFGAAGLLLGFADLGHLLYRRPDPGGQRLVVTDLVSPPPLPFRGAADGGFDSIRWLAPLVTPTVDFYVVDEEIVDPDIDPATWRLSVGGLVGRPYALTYDELKALPAVERYQTLECISNPVGGNLISTAKWVGIPLPAILDRAGVKPGAVEVVFEAAGGYTDSLSIERAMDDSTLVAIGMNGNVLPRAHGYPARLLSVGTYGMKNPKWLTGIRVVDAPYQGFWEQRGWTKAAVVQTESRIDAPLFGASLPLAGTVSIAGIAFAGDRGISKVEVSPDGGHTWQQADLEPALSEYTWRRWMVPWASRHKGRIEIMVRAYDGSGAVQTRGVRAPHPSGATGYDDVVVSGEPS